MLIKLYVEVNSLINFIETGTDKITAKTHNDGYNVEILVDTDKYKFECNEEGCYITRRRNVI